MTEPPDNVISAAVAAALRSPCAKSKRGAVVYAPTSGAILGAGCNGQPEPFACIGSDQCRAACGKLCVHAEQRAIRDALPYWIVATSGRRSLMPLELVHAKVVDGKLVASGGPSCWQCSREILDVRLASVWLYEADEADPAFGLGRWRRYTAEEFHRATAAHHGLPLEVRR